MSDKPSAASSAAPETVTLKGLMASRESLRRLVQATEDQIAGKLAEYYGVGVGDRVEYPEGLMWVRFTTCFFQGDTVTLAVHGAATKTSGLTRVVFWDPATCRVMRKAPV